MQILPVVIPAKAGIQPENAGFWIPDQGRG